MVAFYVATFGVTHLVTTAYRLRGGTWKPLDTFVVANGIMLIPGLTALVFTRWVFREPVRDTLGLKLKPNRWWLAAWLGAPVLMLATLGVSLVVPGTSYDPTMSGLGERVDSRRPTPPASAARSVRSACPRSPASSPRVSSSVRPSASPAAWVKSWRGAASCTGT